MARGLVGFGTHIPHNRLQTARIGDALGQGGGRGTRSVASYDEDPTSMGVEAARMALRGLPSAAEPCRVYFSTANPPYLDKTSASVIHEALGLAPATLAVDMNGAVRSGVGAILAGAESPESSLVVLSDIRTGLPGSADERQGGDAAAALLFGSDSPSLPVLADLIAHSSVSREFLDRWRAVGEPASHVWEERFGEHVYGPLAADSFSAALKSADLEVGDVDHLIVCGTGGRAAQRFASASGVATERVAPDLAGRIGNPGAAAPAVRLADVLERAAPGETIALVVLADGASTLVFRTTDALANHARSAPSVATQIAGGDDSLTYAAFLTWRGMLRREPPRRPEPDAPAGPPSHRSKDWKFGFRGSRCDECGTTQLPPSRSCYHCGAIDAMSAVPMADKPAHIATFTIDRLAFTPSPPMIAAVIDFDGGGRFRCELTDAAEGDVAIGNRVEMTFRRLLTADGVHNYFWKARPARAGGEEG